jgi:hypothetical protein
MTVEKILPLPHLTTDPQVARVSGRGAGRSPRGFRSFSPGPGAASAPPDGPAHLFDDLVLPLPESLGGPTVPDRIARASYAQTSGRRRFATIVDGRLPEQALRREVESMLRNAAETRGLSLRRLLAEARPTPRDRLPSSNLPGASYLLKTRVPAYDEDGSPRLFDLYLSRLTAVHWEATLYRRDPKDVNPDFPYSEPPADARLVLIDPLVGRVAASVAAKLGQPGVVKPGRQLTAPELLGPIGMGVGLTVLAVALVALTIFLSWRVAALLLFALALTAHLVSQEPG